MFTGIVRERGRVASVEGGTDGVRLVVDAPATASQAALGDSVAVSGVCLTVVAADGIFTVALVPHTLDVTTLGDLDTESKVNLEVDVLAKYVESLIAPS